MTSLIMSTPLYIRYFRNAKSGDGDGIEVAVKRIARERCRHTLLKSSIRCQNRNRKFLQTGLSTRHPSSEFIYDKQSRELVNWGTRSN